MPSLRSLQQSTTRFEAISRRINTVMLLLAATVLVSLVLEYGFYFDAATERIFEILDVAVLCCFIASQAVKFLIAPDRELYVRERWFEYAMTGLLLVSLAAMVALPGFFTGVARQWHLHGISALFVLVAQTVMVLSLLSGAVRVSRRIASTQIQPARLFIGSFVFVILSGAAALLLPRATTQEISVVDALFTSTSAVCVTGLTAIDTAMSFTTLGKFIILVLIQVGGLGLMTFTTFFTLFSGRLSIRERVLMQDFLSRENLGEVRRTLLHIVGVTLMIETIGAVLLFFSWDASIYTSLQQRLFSAVFHSVSAFCNAGFSLFSDNLAGSASAFNVQVNLTISGLIILGGLGFITIVNIVNVRPWTGGQRRLSHRLTAHSRVVIVSTLILLFAGMALFLLIESGNSLRGLGWGDKILASFFQSVTTRTAGFNTIDIGAMAVPSTLLFLTLMFIGASPGSTGGGIKTTTAALILLSAINLVRGKSSIEIGNRRIPQSNVDRATAALFFGIVLLALSVFAVSFFEPFPILDVIFECVSAMGTVGLSRGITFALADSSKIVLILTMLIGRVGALTLIMAMTTRAPLNRFDYPTEQIMVG